MKALHERGVGVGKLQHAGNQCNIIVCRIFSCDLSHIWVLRMQYFLLLVEIDCISLKKLLETHSNIYLECFLRTKLHRAQ